jgi:hypothetical protein
VMRQLEFQMSPKRRVVPTILVVILLAAAAPAPARIGPAVPRDRLGTSLVVTSGGGVVAGHPYRTRSAVIVWSRKWHTLTLYLIRRRKVNCRRLMRAVQVPGHLIQVHVTNKPRVRVGRPMAHPEVAFVTVYRDPSRPEHIAGLKHGAKLTFERVDSYPHGIWRGRFSLPTRVYGDDMIYGYRGSFAARFCQMKR